jgi:GNAT superfamily N-acetyltransferase
MAAAAVEVASEKEADQCIALIVLAFAGDPAARFLYPDPTIYIDCFPRFVRAFGGNAFAAGSAHFVDGAAVALWLPPQTSGNDEALMALFEETVPSGHRERVLAIVEEMGAYHPHEPHWYLPLIGTDPPKQGRGYGSLLLAHVTSICDLDGLPAYLESSNPRNIPLYQRHGFERLGTIQVGDSPPITPMLRVPR